MNESPKNLLRNLLIEGDVNVKTYNKIKDGIFERCQMNNSRSKDRALWSMWINGKTVPNRFCQATINAILQQNQLPKIYD